MQWIYLIYHKRNPHHFIYLEIEPNVLTYSFQIKLVNLKPVKRMHFTFDPFNPQVKSIRHILFHFSSEKIRATNAKCVYKTDIVSDR